MGTMYANSTKDGVIALKKGDYESAMSNFMTAANAGDKVAQQNLGVMYNNGIGVRKDKEKATYWFKMATQMHGQFGAYYRSN